MKRLLLSCTMAALFLWPVLCRAQSDVWKFSDENAMKQAITQYVNNPRATYYIIMRAHRIGLGPLAATIYQGMLDKNPDDAYLQCDFAFSHFMATSMLSGTSLSSKTFPAIMKLRQLQMKAEYNRDAATAHMPSSPEASLEIALALAYNAHHVPNVQSRRLACTYARQAVKLAPKWADAHYWFARILNLRWAAEAPKGPSFVAEELAELQKAEILEPHLHGDCMLGRAYAYQELNQMEDQLRCLNEYISTRPSTTVGKNIFEWRDSLRAYVKNKN